MVDAQVSSLDPTYVAFSDVTTFLRDYSDGDVRVSARSVWRALVLFFPGRLVVECALCGKAYGTCTCEVQGELVDGKQAYYIASMGNPCPMAAIKHWRITRASLRALDLEEVRRNMGIPVNGRWRVVAFVEWIQKR